MSTKQKNCTACKHRSAFFYRPYSGQYLCKKCFTESIDKKVRATIAKNDMFTFHDKIAVAVSGGKDSLTLLQILANMEKLRPKATLMAITVDEGIKGYRDESMKLAAAKCNELGIQQHVVSFEELYGCTLDELVANNKQRKDNELTPCAYCGVLRRRALNVAAREVAASKVATGHTLDDETQTILMNVLRGDLERLTKVKPVTDEVHPSFVRKVKPLCKIPERESALYAYVKKINFQSTPCPYASQAYRNDVRTTLNRMEEKYAGTKFTVFNFAERIQPALEKLERKTTYGECRECGEPASDALCKVCELLKKKR